MNRRKDYTETTSRSVEALSSNGLVKDSSAVTVSSSDRGQSGLYPRTIEVDVDMSMAGFIIVGHIGNRDEYPLSNERLLKEMGVASKATLMKYRSELLDLGWITIRQGTRIYRRRAVPTTYSMIGAMGIRIDASPIIGRRAASRVFDVRTAGSMWKQESQSCTARKDVDGATNQA